jgi:uncharacterized protein (TIGR00251 family)
MRIIIEVKAESRDESVEVLDNGHYLVSVKASRTKGKANQAVCKVLKKYFHKQVTLVSGASSTLKVFEISQDLT